jgi:Flp pilus assembly pilin Flp
MRDEKVGGRERGQNVVEYGLMIATIALVILLGVVEFGSDIKPWFESLAAKITTVGT